MCLFKCVVCMCVDTYHEKRVTAKLDFTIQLRTKNEEEKSTLRAFQLIFSTYTSSMCLCVRSLALGLCVCAVCCVRSFQFFIR